MQINLSKVAECSEVALFEKTFLIFTIKSMMYSRRFRLSLEETKPYFDCVNCSCRNKMSCVSEMNTRWHASNKFQGFLIVPDLRSCTMLSTLPLFYIAQSVNSDDRRARFQGLRVIMHGKYFEISTATKLTRLFANLGRYYTRRLLRRSDALNGWLLSASRFYTRRLKRLRRLIHLLSTSIGRT